ncbi:MAG: hypothetical protein QNJ54_04545 [Prochloraceae cyanobacterium]|nr:hypothetical protein [Prochloraceae cyanobacterium]
MPLVFVHGVGSRENEQYRKNLYQRNDFFKNTVLKQVFNNPNTEIFNPMWGKHVPEMPEDNPIIPLPGADAELQSFGPDSNLMSEMIPAVHVGDKVPEDKKLLTLAQQSFPDFIDQLWIRAAHLPEVDNDERRRSELVEAGIVASAYAQENPNPDWAVESANDDELLERLIRELEGWTRSNVSSTNFESMGAEDRLFGWLKKGARIIKRRVTDIPKDILLRKFRPSLTLRTVRFFGDVFYYQAYRGKPNNPGSIVSTVLNDLLKAREIADRRQEKLIVVGHSMGGNILYDILTYFDTTLKVDIFATVGCQASLFKQLALFAKQKEDQSSGVLEQGKAPKPPAVDKWHNIFDPQDVLGFAFEPEFEGVEDFVFESDGGISSAHGDYFKRIRFYERLTDRILNNI